MVMSMNEAASVVVETVAGMLFLCIALYGIDLALEYGRRQFRGALARRSSSPMGGGNRLDG